MHKVKASEETIKTIHQAKGVAVLAHHIVKEALTDQKNSFEKLFPLMGWKGIIMQHFRGSNEEM